MTQAGLSRDLTEGEAGAGQRQELLIGRSGLAMLDRPSGLDPHNAHNGDRTRGEQVQSTNLRVRIPSSVGRDVTPAGGQGGPPRCLDRPPESKRAYLGKDVRVGETLEGTLLVWLGQPEGRRKSRTKQTQARRAR
jgi:hypothetical protein